MDGDREPSFIVGRIEDLTIRGGDTVSPREVEDDLYRHPDVQDMAVFGVADPRDGEEVCAWVRPRPDAALTADAVRDFCTGRIAHRKMPRHVAIVDVLPMTVTGKVQKFPVRAEMERRLGLSAEATARREGVWIDRQRNLLHPIADLPYGRARAAFRDPP